MSFRGSEHMAGGGAERRGRLKIVTKDSSSSETENESISAERRRGTVLGTDPGAGTDFQSVD